MIRLEHGNCLEIMDKLIDEGVKVDMVLAMYDRLSDSEKESFNNQIKKHS